MADCVDDRGTGTFRGENAILYLDGVGSYMTWIHLSKLIELHS